MYDAFINKWGNNVKQVTKFGGECVAAVAEYEAENNLPIVWGDAHQWINNPVMLPVYDWVDNNPNDPNQLPPRGAIIVWNLPNEHIAFFDHQLDNHQFMSYGQNSGGKQLHFQPHSWNGVAGWYVPKQQSIVHPYTIEQIPEKQVRINKDTHRWGMTYDNFTAMASNPIGGIVGTGETKTVRAICHHNIGYSYYLEDPNEPSGYNTLDCDDIPAPQPTPVVSPPPTPYVPPAAPVSVARAETYTLVVPLPYYDTPQIAINKGTALGTIPSGTYYVWDKDGKVFNLSTSNMKSEGKWVNTLDNVMPVYVPVSVLPKEDNDWKMTRSWFYSDRNKYDLYELQADAVIRDLDGKGKEFLVFANKPNSSDNAMLKVHGTVSKDGIKYYLLHLPEDVNWENWYAIPMVNPHTRKAYLLKYADLYDISVKKNQVTPGEEAIAALMSLGYKIFDVLSPRKIREWLNKK